MSRTARTGVVIVNDGEPADTFGCLDSLEQSDDLDLDLVVVDDGPRSTSRHELLSAGVGRRAEVVATGADLGPAGAGNVGIRRLLERGVEFVWLLSPLARVEPPTLTRLLRVLDQRAEVGVVGPRLVVPGTPAAKVWYDGGVVDVARWGATRHRAQGRPEDDAPRPRVRDTDYVTGAALLTRAAVLGQAGLLPERYHLYFEDADWCLQAARLGWTCAVQSRARMTYLRSPRTGPPEPRQVYYLTRNRYLFARDVLGVDPESALADLDAHQLARWRTRVGRQAPAWLPTYDDLVARAKADARSGRDGRADEIAAVPGAAPVTVRVDAPATEPVRGQ